MDVRQTQKAAQISLEERPSCAAVRSVVCWHPPTVRLLRAYPSFLVEITLFVVQVLPMTEQGVGRRV